ncbi:hypothetical protein ACVIWV_000865 [Bradyrhizobium diazoefficiens]
MPGARSSSRWKVQDRPSVLSSAAMFWSGRPPSMIWSELNSICAGIGACGIAARPARSAGRMRSGLGVVLAGQLVGIDLARRQHRAQQRRGAEPEIADAADFQRIVLGAKACVDLVELGAGGIGLEFCGELPGRRPGLAGLLRRRHGQRQRAVEFRQAVVEGEHAFEIGEDGALAGVDVEVETRGAAVGARAGGDAERVARAARGETAVAAHRAGQRADVAGEGDVGELQRRAAGGIVQGDAAGEIEALDRQRSQIEGAARGGRQIDPPARVEAEIDRHAIDSQLGGAPFAAHQRAQAELDVELVGAQAAEIVVAAEGDRAQPQRRRRQQPRVELARHPHRHADDPARLRLELGPELVPVDEVGPDQRGQKRNDEGNRQSEQRRLHGSPLGQTGTRAKPCPMEGFRRAGTAPYIGGSVAKSQRLLRAEVNARRRLTSSPASSSGRAARRSSAIPGSRRRRSADPAAGATAWRWRSRPRSAPIGPPGRNGCRRRTTAA